MFHNQRAGFYFALPAIALLVGVLGFPALAAILQSFDLLWTSKPGFSVANYLALPGDPQIRNAFVNSGLLVVANVSLHLALGLGVAMLLNLDVPAKWLFRIIALLPWTVPDVVAGLVWRFMFDTLAGLVNAILAITGLVTDPIDWLGMPGSALFSVIIAEGWRGYPFVMLVLLAGLQAIPSQQYEAAEIDGATKWQAFIHVTLPNLKPMIFIALILDTIYQARLFGLIFGMTGGGPGGATEVVPLAVYRNYFEFFNTSYAASIAVTLAAIMLVIATPYLRASMRREAQA